ncbi:hypothetical protein N431DRAFT_462388 [Stipitochalara longipes BDJ]|nr:hypothetical protein N431DRAFT_462388 [Stipitochalara longipes BDJ]
MNDSINIHSMNDPNTHDEILLATLFATDAPTAFTDILPLNLDNESFSQVSPIARPAMNIPDANDTTPKGGSFDAAIELEIFTLFPDFPTELRLKIWKLALPEPRLVGLNFWKEEEVHIEYASKDGTFSTVLLDACKESARVFRRNYSDSAIILSTSGTSNEAIEKFVRKKLVQHGFIDLERDFLYFDPKTLYDILIDCNSTIVMEGLKKTAVRSLDWASVLILQYDFGQSAFPNLKHLTIVLHKTLNENELRCQHFASSSKQGSTSLSIVHGVLAPDSTTISGTLDFELAQAAELAFHEVVEHEDGINTATIMKNRVTCPWSFFFSQQNYLLMRAAERTLVATFEAKAESSHLLQECIQLQQKVLQLLNGPSQLAVEVSVHRKPDWIILGLQLLLVVAAALFAYSQRP